MRVVRILPWLLLLALVVFSVAVYPDLPAHVPRAVDLSGRVVHATGKSPVAWGSLPLVAMLTQLLIEGLRRRLPRRPDAFNFPGKDDLLKLPMEYHPPIVARMQWFMDVVSCNTVVVLIAVQVMMWYRAHGGDSQTATVALMLGGALMLPVILLLLQRVTAEVERAKRQWESRRNPRAG